MRARNPKADPASVLPDVHPARIPRHIAIIMDGNGRWATQRGFPRFFGHRNGAASVRAVMEECAVLGVEVLTLYSFSLENWKRPDDEVAALMEMYAMYIEGERERIKRENIRFVQIGRWEGLPVVVQAASRRLMEETAGNTGSTLCLAVNYGSRAEITEATREIARKAARGELDPESITETTVSAHLYTAGIPDPDLLIRTAGEMRVSNYLLWQISYAELHVTGVLWPDFGAPDLHAAIRDFAGRKRKFGGLDDLGR
ncbi:MAG: di-trans,poly-cis-decaprenylcistransferase [Phycisphaerales bacterium]|nr:di-trans,poly-cis-decaprenylcistransferase [Phycisphaerales bacterium]